jgi:hypothetical protein
VISMRPALADMRTLTLSVRAARLLLPIDALRSQALKALAAIDHILCNSFASTARMLVVQCLKKETAHRSVFLRPPTALS